MDPKYQFDIGSQIIEWFKNWVKTDDGKKVFKEVLEETLKEFKLKHDHDFVEIEIIDSADLVALKDRTAPIFIDKATSIIYAPVVNADFFEHSLNGRYGEVKDD